MDAMESTQGKYETVWSSLPFPLSDLLLQEIAPKYLTVKDLLHLGAVSKKYKDLLGPKTEQGNRILGEILRQQAKKYHLISGELLFAEQLPTIGNLSVEESLKEDALWVARLQVPALGRRRLLLLPTAETKEQELHLRETIAKFSPKPIPELRAVYLKYRSLNCASPNTEFLGVNLTGVDVYCHFIDGQSRWMLVRDGDRVPPAPDQAARVQSFVVKGEDNLALSYVFRHSSSISHSFALCFQEGGPPFAIYQQRRGWYHGMVGDRVRHTHAIAIHPGGTIQELYCDSTFSSPRPNSFTAHYHFSDRQTGEQIPLFTNDTLEEGEQEVQIAAQAETTEAQLDDNTLAKYLAEAFYGVSIPPLAHECWLREAARDDYLSLLHSSTSLPQSRINPLGEAIWFEEKVENEAEDEDEAEDNQLSAVCVSPP
mmetsp:Transcript_3308/g.3753  ORF Transcript_3308/g.3753 Transcript_3308/m.3753 type:complete len:427 (-) Transcript_3308:84-1364(-)